MSLAEGNGIDEMDFPVYEKPIKRPRMQEELPDVEKQIVHEMAERLHTLVKEGGVKEITI